MVDIAERAFDDGAAPASPVPPRTARPLWGQGWSAVALPMLAVVLVLCGWQALIDWFGMSRFVLPAPAAVAVALVEVVRDGSLLRSLLATGEEAALGFVVAVVGGLAIGGALARSPWLERTVYGYLVALQTMPKIALAPLFVAWFGFGLESKVAIAGLIAFFPMLANVVIGLKSCEEGKIDVLRALAAGEWTIFWRVRLPSALPYIFVGLEIAVVFSLTGAIVGEFIGAQAGIGYLLVALTSQMETARVFAVILVTGVIGLGLQTTVDRLRRRLLVWAPAAQTGNPRNRPLARG